MPLYLAWGVGVVALFFLCFGDSSDEFALATFLFLIAILILIW
jgi:hypothetical protein